MKYIILLGDGMADTPVSQLGGITPLQAAFKPNMDRLAGQSHMGLVKTVPDGIVPGSDVANLSVLGYDPHHDYTGRAPLEAISMGIQLEDDQDAFRCNFVTLSDEEDYTKKSMLDYCAGEISTTEATQLIDALNAHFQNDDLKYHLGISYRHCLIYRNEMEDCTLTPPHDIISKPIATYLPDETRAAPLLQMMKTSCHILENHPVNLARKAAGLNPANAIWLWGRGKKPVLTPFTAKTGLKGSMISAVDLLKGIGLCAGLKSIDVPGATGNVDTNFLGKAQAALQELESGQDFVYIHVEAPDECGHRHEIENKVKAIELIDEVLLGALLQGLEEMGDYRLMVLPDHPTPLALRTHTNDPVPFMVYQKNSPYVSDIQQYDEFQAQTSGLTFNTGAGLMNFFLGGRG